MSRLNLIFSTLTICSIQASDLSHDDKNLANPSAIQTQEPDLSAPTNDSVNIDIGSIQLQNTTPA